MAEQWLSPRMHSKPTGIIWLLEATFGELTAHTSQAPGRRDFHPAGAPWLDVSVGVSESGVSEFFREEIRVQRLN